MEAEGVSYSALENTNIYFPLMRIRFNQRLERRLLSCIAIRVLQKYCHHSTWAKPILNIVLKGAAYFLCLFVIDFQVSRDFAHAE